MRSSANVLIYVNVQKAIDAGLKFFLSSNGVILTEGDESGYLRPEFFLRVTDKNGKDLDYSISSADNAAAASTQTKQSIPMTTQGKSTIAVGFPETRKPDAVDDLQEKTEKLVL